MLERAGHEPPAAASGRGGAGRRAVRLRGALVIPLFDGFHTHSGTTAYPHPFVWRMAWWVPLLFGTSVAGGGLAFALAYPRLGGRRAPPRVPALVVAFAAFALAYWSSG